MRARPARRRLPAAMVIALLLGMSGAATLVLHQSRAAFTATTTNAGNTFTAATIDLSDDDSGAAAFAVSGQLPGDTGQRCFQLTYGGNAPATVKLFVDATTYGGALGPYLDVTIQEGSGSSFSEAPECSTFISSSTIYSGTLAALAAGHTDFATGVGTFAPATAGVTRAYRISYLMRDDNGGQGTAASVDFVWEARTT